MATSTIWHFFPRSEGGSNVKIHCLMKKITKITLKLGYGRGIPWVRIATKHVFPLKMCDQKVPFSFSPNPPKHTSPPRPQTIWLQPSGPHVLDLIGCQTRTPIHKWGSKIQITAYTTVPQFESIVHEGPICMGQTDPNLTCAIRSIYTQHSKGVPLRTLLAFALSFYSFGSFDAQLETLKNAIKTYSKL